MVTNITSLTGNGLKDWLIQRVTAIYFAIYTVFLFAFLLMHPQLQYSEWAALFNCWIFQIASVCALLMLSLHAWIGIWTVTTDYLSNTAIRVIVQMLVFFLLLAQFIWGLMIVWG